VDDGNWKRIKKKSEQTYKRACRNRNGHQTDTETGEEKQRPEHIRKNTDRWKICHVLPSERIRLDENLLQNPDGTALDGTKANRLGIGS
jgi:hypothetical protein